MTETIRAALARDIQTAIDGYGPEARVTIAFHDLANGDEYSRDAEERQHPASTMKLCVMAELFHQAEQGLLALDDRLTLGSTFLSLADGSPYTLQASDDSETTLYPRLGETETLRELCRLMIVRSSNLATNLLVGKLTAERATAFMQSLGADDLIVARGVQDEKAFQQGISNVASARGLCILLTALAKRELVSPQASAEMIDILLGQELLDGLPAGVPPGVRIANKTGSIHAVSHDAGIVYPSDGGKPYVLAVMTRGIADEKAGRRLIADISRLFYAAARGT